MEAAGSQVIAGWPLFVGGVADDASDVCVHPSLVTSL